jgi:hypothetical protein
VGRDDAARKLRLGTFLGTGATWRLGDTTPLPTPPSISTTSKPDAQAEAAKFDFAFFGDGYTLAKITPNFLIVLN